MIESHVASMIENQ
jgi:hypothetical protein